MIGPFIGCTVEYDPCQRVTRIQYGKNPEAQRVITDVELRMREGLNVLHEELRDWAHRCYAYEHPEILAYEVESV